LRAPETDDAKRKEIEFATKLRWEIIVNHWVQLIAHGCSEGEVKKLFAYVATGAEGEQRKVAENIVNKTVELSNAVAKTDPSNSTITAKIAVGQQSLRWLANGTGDNFLASLAALWPRVLVGASSSTVLDEVLQFFGGFPTNLAGIQFVQAYAVDRNPRPAKESRRKAMKWLAANFPRDAVRMWSSALFDSMTDKDPGTLVEDVTELLSICGKNNVEVPEFPTKLPPDVVKTLAVSEMPQARLTAVRALQEMDLKTVDRAEAPLLNALRSDSSTIVAAAARLAWRAFFGGKDVKAESSGGDSPPGELEAAETVDQSSGASEGKGKGKGK